GGAGGKSGGGRGVEVVFAGVGSTGEGRAVTRNCAGGQSRSSCWLATAPQQWGSAALRLLRPPGQREQKRTCEMSGARRGIAALLLALACAGGAHGHEAYFLLMFGSQ